MPIRPSRRTLPLIVEQLSARERRLRQANRIKELGSPALVACKLCLSRKVLCVVMLSEGTKCEVCTRQGKKCSFRSLDTLESEYHQTQNKLRLATARQNELLAAQDARRRKFAEAVKVVASLAEEVKESTTEVQGAISEVSQLLVVAHDAEQSYRQAVIHESQALAILEGPGLSGVSEDEDMDAAGDVDFEAVLNLGGS